MSGQSVVVELLDLCQTLADLEQIRLNLGIAPRPARDSKWLDQPNDRTS